MQVAGAVSIVDLKVTVNDIVTIAKMNEGLSTRDTLLDEETRRWAVLSRKGRHKAGRLLLVMEVHRSCITGTANTMVKPDYRALEL